jgi:glycosyltransferase involved in cell wall biosynthesis
MRIVMLTQFYPPFAGGEEQVVWNLSTELVKRGHHVSVATMGADGLPERTIEDGVSIHRLRSTAQRARWLYHDHSRPHVPPVPDPEIVRGLRRVMREERPEVVHAHNWLVHSFLPLKWLTGAKLALSLHDYSFVCATKKLLRLGTICSGPGPLKCLGCAAAHYGAATGPITALSNWGMGATERRIVDLFLPVSEATARDNRLDVHELPYRIIPNFLSHQLGETPDVDPYLRRLPAGDFLLFAGALGAYKGIDVLLEAYARLDRSIPLVLIGYPTAESPIRTRDLPEGVSILGEWPHAALMEAWRRSAVALVPSLVKETFGMVALEAMSAGTPVIASRIGGLPEVIDDGTTGLLVEPGSPVEMRNALRRLIDDPDLRRRMALAGAERARVFSADAVVPRFEDAYRSMGVEAKAPREQFEVAGPALDPQDTRTR